MIGLARQSREITMNRHTRRAAARDGIKFGSKAETEEGLAEQIQAKHRDLMNKIMKTLDIAFPGMSITLLVAEPNTADDIAAGTERRLNYISNSQRAEMLNVMKEFIAKHEGRLMDEPDGVQ
jgi:hypothetical protein